MDTIKSAAKIDPLTVPLFANKETKSLFLFCGLTFPFLHHGTRLREGEALHGLVALAHGSLLMASVHEHPAVEGVALLARSLSAPRPPICSCGDQRRGGKDQGRSGCGDIEVSCSSLSLTAGLGEILVELLAVLVVDDVVDAGVDQLLLLVLQVLCHVV